MSHLEITCMVLAGTQKRYGYLAPIDSNPNEFLAEVKRLAGDRPIGNLARRDEGWWLRCPSADLDT